MNEVLFVTFFCGGLLAGFIGGYCRRDWHYESLLRAQQQRGDYWFDRYQQYIKEAEEWTQ